MNETAYILHRLNSNESYVIMYWLVHKTYLFDEEHQWMLHFRNKRTPKYLVLCTYPMVLPLKTTLVISQIMFVLHLKNMYTDFFTLKVIECIDHKLTGVAGDLLKMNNNT